jgi:hypothetical protein
MMSLGRILGGFMVVAGVGLLVRYFYQWSTTGSVLPVAMSDMWGSSDNLMRDFMAKSAVDQVYQAMLSGWGAALLIILGVLLVWGCRTGPLKE